MGFEVRPSLLAYHAVALKNLAAGEDNRFPRNVRIYIYIYQTKLHETRPQKTLNLHTCQFTPTASKLTYSLRDHKLQDSSVLFC